MFGRIFGLVYRGLIFRGLICGGLYVGAYMWGLIFGILRYVEKTY